MINLYKDSTVFYVL